MSTGYLILYYKNSLIESYIRNFLMTKYISLNNAIGSNKLISKIKYYHRNYFCFINKEKNSVRSIIKLNKITNYQIDLKIKSQQELFINEIKKSEIFRAESTMVEHFFNLENNTDLNYINNKINLLIKESNNIYEFNCILLEDSIDIGIFEKIKKCMKDKENTHNNEIQNNLRNNPFISNIQNYQAAFGKKNSDSGSMPDNARNRGELVVEKNEKEENFFDMKYDKYFLYDELLTDKNENGNLKGNNNGYEENKLFKKNKINDYINLEGKYKSIFKISDIVFKKPFSELDDIKNDITFENINSSNLKNISNNNTNITNNKLNESIADINNSNNIKNISNYDSSNNNNSFKKNDSYLNITNYNSHMNLNMSRNSSNNNNNSSLIKDYSYNDKYKRNDSYNNSNNYGYKKDLGNNSYDNYSNNSNNNYNNRNDYNSYKYYNSNNDNGGSKYSNRNTNFRESKQYKSSYNMDNSYINRRNDSYNNMKNYSSNNNYSYHSSNNSSFISDRDRDRDKERNYSRSREKSPLQSPNNNDRYRKDSPRQKPYDRYNDRNILNKNNNYYGDNNNINYYYNINNYYRQGNMNRWNDNNYHQKGGNFQRNKNDYYSNNNHYNSHEGYYNRDRRRGNQSGGY